MTPAGLKYLLLSAESAVVRRARSAGCGFQCWSNAATVDETTIAKVSAASSKSSYCASGVWACRNRRIARAAGCGSLPDGTAQGGTGVGPECATWGGAAARRLRCVEPAARAAGCRALPVSTWVVLIGGKSACTPIPLVGLCFCRLTEAVDRLGMAPGSAWAVWVAAVIDAAAGVEAVRGCSSSRLEPGSAWALDETDSPLRRFPRTSRIQAGTADVKSTKPVAVAGTWRSARAPLTVCGLCFFKFTGTDGHPGTAPIAAWAGRGETASGAAAHVDATRASSP